MKEYYLAGLVRINMSLFIFISFVSHFNPNFADPLHRIEVISGPVNESTTIPGGLPELTPKPPYASPPNFFNMTRRILKGHEVGDTRPYMVYLRPAAAADASKKDTNWLCGGVIIHERYILTSAACIEDVGHFFVISGTHKWVPMSDDRNDCVKYGAKKAIWKCVPKSYVYDGHEFDNIRWMKNDIAVVKTEDDFSFTRRVKGCDFIPKKIAYNNKSADYEKSGTHASTAGWGSTDLFSDIIARTAANSPELLETEVQLISRRNCRRRWPERYHHILDDGIVCGKDSMDTDTMSTLCSEQEVNCKELVYSDEKDEDEEADRRKRFPDPNSFRVHENAFATHIANNSRRTKISSGGFCENDHGGPLIVGQGKTAIVIGVICACLTKEFTNKCYGPFLYTSIWKHRHLISCAIEKEMGAKCRKLLGDEKMQMIETTFDWTDQSNSKDPPKSRSFLEEDVKVN